MKLRRNHRPTSAPQRQVNTWSLWGKCGLYFFLPFFWTCKLFFEYSFSDFVCCFHFCVLLSCFYFKVLILLFVFFCCYMFKIKYIQQLIKKSQMVSRESAWSMRWKTELLENSFGYFSYTDDFVFYFLLNQIHNIQNNRGCRPNCYFQHQYQPRTSPSVISHNPYSYQHGSTVSKIIALLQLIWFNYRQTGSQWLYTAMNYNLSH